jgi:hypothetical protein
MDNAVQSCGIEASDVGIRLRYECRPWSGSGGPPGGVEVFLSGRPDVVYVGASEHDAVEMMLYGVAELAFERNLIPTAPGICGNPDPIQCGMSLLEQALRRAVQEREQLVLISQDNKESLDKRAPERARLSELIGNLGTAIAALARVKHD